MLHPRESKEEPLFNIKNLKSRIPGNIEQKLMIHGITIHWEIRYLKWVYFLTKNKSKNADRIWLSNRPQRYPFIP